MRRWPGRSRRGGESNTYPPRAVLGAKFGSVLADAAGEGRCVSWVAYCTWPEPHDFHVRAVGVPPVQQDRERAGPGCGGRGGGSGGRL